MKPICQFLTCLLIIGGCVYLIYRTVKQAVADAVEMPIDFIEKDTPEGRIFTELESEVYEHSPESIF